MRKSSPPRTRKIRTVERAALGTREDEPLRSALRVLLHVLLELVRHHLGNDYGPRRRALFEWPYHRAKACHLLALAADLHAAMQVVNVGPRETQHLAGPQSSERSEGDERDS